MENSPTRHREAAKLSPTPTTFVQADTSSFKQIVQLLTGSTGRLKPNPTHKPDPRSGSSSQFSIPPIKAIPNKKQSSSSSSSFRLYERRKNFKIKPVYNPVNFNRKPKNLSPSILDFPSLALSPVTPLVPDPFDGTGSSDLEEKAIKEKGFYLIPSPVTSPMNPEPRLLTLFPLTSPRFSDSSSSSS
ncbi:unnamed protein product [Cochlearia groenlandica]